MNERHSVLPVDGLLKVYRRSGIWGLVLWTTLVSVVLSLVICCGIGLLPLWMMGQMDSSRLVSTIVVSTATPIMVAPPVSWAIGVLLERLSVANEQLVLLASTDDLTGVLNRRGFFEHASRLIDKTRSPALPVLALVGLDQLKQLNDDHGHEAGDQALISVATKLRTLAVDGAVVARFGGGEFAVMIGSTIGETVFRSRLAEELDRIVLPGGIRVSLVIGATVVEPGEPLDLALARADHQLYRSRQFGHPVQTDRPGLAKLPAARHRRQTVN